jgi:simple sugar transport system permease protein
MFINLLFHILSATVVAGTPFIIVALGELITEKSGVLNLGAEGIMSVAAVSAFAVTHSTHSSILGLLAGMSAGMLMSLLFGVATLTLMANQVASGLALSIFGLGLSAFIGKPYESMVLDNIPPVAIPLLSRIPFFGPLLFEQQWLVYLSWILVVAVAWFLYYSKSGLILRAVGESPSSAHAIGYNVVNIRYQTVLFGGAMAGMGGAFISVFDTHTWVEGLVAGRGWIAIALVVFATWRPARVMLGAYLFGGCMIMQTFIQSYAIQAHVPTQFLSAVPYLATIFVLVVISRNRSSIALNSIKSLGQHFFPDK